MSKIYKKIHYDYLLKVVAEKMRQRKCSYCLKLCVTAYIFDLKSVCIFLITNINNLHTVTEFDNFEIA